MSRRRQLPDRVRRAVAERAGHACEYCRHRDDFAHDPFEVEHIIPLADPLGTDALDNLAYSCGGCNGLKGVRTEGADPITGEPTALFHPRRQRWEEHFAWNPDFTQMIGLTPCGRATVETLSLNRPGLQNLRRALHLDGWHPPMESA